MTNVITIAISLSPNMPMHNQRELRFKPLVRCEGFRYTCTNNILIFHHLNSSVNLVSIMRIPEHQLEKRRLVPNVIYQQSTLSVSKTYAASGQQILPIFLQPIAAQMA